MQWLPGHKLTNRPYQIEQELGQGGFGITYKARDLSLDVSVVIKTPNQKLQRDHNYQKYVRNFIREAKQLAKLGLNPHPHIVRVTSLFEEDNLPCIVMDLIPGQSLYDLVLTQGKLSETQALKYIKQIASALVVCHNAGIIHRDVHPNNILIHANSGKAILIDFGIAGTTQTSRNTHSGNRCFAPWEQMAYWEGENSKTPQVDIYTLAASLYFLVTGQEPTECLARKYNQTELIVPKQLNTELSDQVNQAILKGLEIEPENRPNSMSEWLQMLTCSTKEISTSTSQPRTNSDNTIKDNRPRTLKPSKNFQQREVEVVATQKNNSSQQDQPRSTPVSKRKNRFNKRFKKLIAGGSIFIAVLLISIYTTGTINRNATSKIISVDNLENLSRLQEEHTFSLNSSEFSSVAFSPNGKTLAGSGRGEVKLWNLANKSETATFTNSSKNVVNPLAFSPDGKILAGGSGDGTVKLWNLGTKELATLGVKLDDPETMNNAVQDALSSKLKAQKLGEMINATLIKLSGLPIAFSPDGTTLASSSADETIKLWNATTRQEITTLTGHSRAVYRLVFSPDGTILASSSADDTIKLWDVALKREIATLTGHSAGIYGLAFNPHGTTLASGSRDDTIKLWDIATQQEIATLTGHDHTIYALAFSPDSTILASSSGDNTIKLWDMTTQQEIATLTGHSEGITGLAFSPDGTTLASSSADKTIKLWKIKSN